MRGLAKVGLGVRRPAAIAGAFLIAGGTYLGLCQVRADAATPAVTITPVGQAASGPALHDGEAVTVSVGRNSLFTPGTRVNILECTDPGGTSANLPKSISNCDGETIQGNTVLVQADGSIDENQYTIYELPSAALGEQANEQPVCNPTNECVLYVGEDQENFNEAKVFSSPFTVSASTGTAGPEAVSGTVATTSTSTAASSATVSVATAGSGSASGGSSEPASSAVAAGQSDPSPGSLAYTGTPRALPWLIVAAGILVLVGSTGRRLTGARR